MILNCAIVDDEPLALEVFSVTGFFYAKSKGKRKTAAQGFVPSRKTAQQDYLRQAWERRRKKP